MLRHPEEKCHWLRVYSHAAVAANVFVSAARVTTRLGRMLQFGPALSKMRQPGPGHEGETHQVIENGADPEDFGDSNDFQ